MNDTWAVKPAHRRLFDHLHDFSVKTVCLNVSVMCKVSMTFNGMESSIRRMSTKLIQIFQGFFLCFMPFVD